MIEYVLISENNFFRTNRLYHNRIRVLTKFIFTKFICKVMNVLIKRNIFNYILSDIKLLREPLMFKIEYLQLKIKENNNTMHLYEKSDTIETYSETKWVKVSCHFVSFCPPLSSLSINWSTYVKYRILLAQVKDQAVLILCHSFSL